MEKKAKGLLLPLLGAAVFGLSSCGFFNGSGNYSIKEVTSTVNDVGDTVVRISYTDSRIADTVFTIPKGQSGVSIEGLEATYDPVEEEVTVRVEYSDGREEELLTYPVVTGVGIDSIVYERNQAGATTSFYFVYTDGSLSDSIILPTGNGIASIEFSEPDAVTGAKTMTVTLDDGSTYVETIEKGEKGDPGRGIEDISFEFNPVSGGYTVTIVYTDGSDAVLEDVGASKNGAHWYQDAGSPVGNPSYADYAEGSFYIDTMNRIIYYKNSTSWVLFHAFGSEVNFTVTFHPEGGEIELLPGLIVGEEGTYYLSVPSAETIELPGASLDGHRFTGWWTAPSDIEDPNAGHFVDTTPVNRDLDLYAHYEAL